MSKSLKRICAFTAALSMLISSVPMDKNNIVTAATSNEASELFENDEVLFIPQIDIQAEESDSDEETFINGTWGDNITYTLDKESGVLVISGDGNMKSSSDYYSEMPFYSYREYIKSVIVNEGVTSVCNYAFLSCELLESVTLSSSIRKIGESSFRNCKILKEIELPEGTETIDDYVFRGCSALEKVKLPESLTELGNYVFDDCSSLKSILLPDNLSTVGKNLFDSCSSLEEVVLSENLDSISDSMFNGCSSLKEISIPDSVKSLNSKAFYECTALETISLPDTVTEIGESVFYGCNLLNSVVLSENITSIPSNAFNGCTVLESIELPDNLEYIGSSAFYNCNKLASLSIPESVTEIGTSVFYGCTLLNSVTLSKNITSIPSNAFNGCTVLESIELPDNLEYIGSNAFCGCNKLTSISIPESVTEIDDSAFASCENLVSVELSDGLISIGECVFSDCYLLENISIPSTVISIGSGAFDNTLYSALQGGEFIVTENGVLYEYRGTDSEVVIPDNVKTIASSLFKEKTDIISVVLPEGITELGDECFSGCTSLERINFPESLKKFNYRAFYDCSSLSEVVISEGITEINEECFSGCTSLKTVKLPESLKKIDYKAFYGCSSLSEVDISDNIEYIEKEAFDDTPFIDNQEDDMVILGKVLYKYNGNEKSVVIPEGITAISYEAFLFHMNLESVKLPSTLVSIGENAFLGCHALSSIIIPNSVEEIGNRALGYYCNNGYSGFYETMDSFILLSSSKCSAVKVYAEDNDLDIIYTDFEDNKCGEDITFSLDFETGVLTLEGKGEINDYDNPAYYNCENPSPFYAYRSFIKSVKIGEGITSTGVHSFSDLINVTFVSLPESLTNIKNYSFKGCTSLSEIILPEGLESIGDYAFSYSSVVNLDLPAVLENISESAFNYDNSLASITVDENNKNYKSDNGILYDYSKSKIIIYPADSNIEKLTLPSSMTSIPNSVLKSKKLRCLIVPKSVTLNSGSINLNDCVSLERIVFMGNAPRNSSYYSSGNYPDITCENNVIITCSFSETGWVEMMESCTSDSIIWEDKDKLSTYNTLKIEGIPKTIYAGNSFKLNAKLNPLLETLFNWSINDNNIGTIESDGTFKALSTGTAIISCSSFDGRYNAEIQITVEPVSEDSTSFRELEQYEYVSELSADIVGSPFTSLQIPCEELFGMYFLNDSMLSFYSFNTNSVEWSTKFDTYNDAYESDGKLYLLYKDNYCVFDLKKQKIVGIYSLPSGFTGKAIGADHKNRVYVYAYNSNNSVDKRLFLMDENGDVLSSTSAPVSFYNFDGFDTESDTFFMETYYDYYSWGYHHPGRALNAGIISDGQIYCVNTSNSFLEQGIITRNFSCIEYLCQDVYLEHQNGASVIGGKYLISRSPMTNTFTVRDVKNLKTLMSLNRTVEEFDLSSTWSDPLSVGTRTVYNPENDSIIMYDNDKRLSEYYPETGDLLNSFELKEYVYSLTRMGDYVIAVERSEEGKYSMELIEWKNPEEVEIECEKTEMTVGEFQSLKVKSETLLNSEFSFTSSDPSVISVTERGITTAWKEGTAVITCTDLRGNVKSEITINAKPKEVIGTSTLQKLEGVITNNKSGNNYSIRNSPASSFLIESNDGNLMRVENADEGIIVETFNTEGKITDTKTIDMDLPIFGGFYDNGESYFIITGQKNESESDSAEIMRICRYSHDWEYEEKCSVYGANTYIPFDAGDVSIDKSGDKLYIHTSHEMYADESGTHHQANMTYVLNVKTMKMEQSYYDVDNVMLTGYVSHSFAQYIRTDDEFVYRVDHGDGGPRAVSLTKAPLDGKITDVYYHEAYKIRGWTGDNATGVSVGGLELSENNCLIAINSVDMDADSYSASGNRNIILLVTTKKDMKTKQIPLTNYTVDDEIKVRTPQIIKVTNNAFVIMWEEEASDKSTCVKVVTCDEDGNVINSTTSSALELSDCNPIVASDGFIKWYVSNGKKVSLYSFNPFNFATIEELNKIPGDVDDDGVISTKDVVLIRRYIAGGWDVTLEENVADVNDDGSVDSKDVVLLRRYIAGGWDITLQ